MNDLEVAKDLRAAADYLRTYGWMQRCLGEDGGSRCVGGAFCSISGAYNERSRYLASVLGFTPGKANLSGSVYWVPMVDWNNARGRTLDEVLDRLESTALALEVRALASEKEHSKSVELVAVSV